MAMVTWIEIPVRDLARATAFYKGVFQLQDLSPAYDEGVRQTQVLYYEGENSIAAGVSLTQTANFEPSDKGLYAYFDCGEDMSGHMARVTEHGGTLTTDKVSMGEAGFYCSVKDTEGNIIGLYSTK